MLVAFHPLHTAPQLRDLRVAALPQLTQAVLKPGLQHLHAPAERLCLLSQGGPLRLRRHPAGDLNGQRLHTVPELRHKGLLSLLLPTGAPLSGLCTPLQRRQAQVQTIGRCRQACDLGLGDLPRLPRLRQSLHEVLQSRDLQTEASLDVLDPLVPGLQSAFQGLNPASQGAAVFGLLFAYADRRGWRQHVQGRRWAALLLGALLATLFAVQRRWGAVISKVGAGCGCLDLGPIAR
mmetsp:Transcript_75312/g.232450  ORF Transcript_75312/g.232450 Transcript_75312/m.232450 type:complete len:235 (-) Transcript_75312:878-1582(-)